uniref:Uncharacterized protein LOC111111920 isoform X3 n=1 Tax=Crassostrea virginica TaxID=6565 RepID=A0A8B8BPP3_CRAVI|nr:uncharacterized protein LOC111111920 isoform X3 [Crassostrea virginica]
MKELSMLLGFLFQYCALHAALPEGIYNAPVTWEEATKSCHLSLIHAADVADQSSSSFWQPFVSIQTKPIIPKGCRDLMVPKIKASRYIQNNNVTNCYHFCNFNVDNKELLIEAFLIKGGNCSCVKHYDHDDKPRRDCPNCTCIQSDGRDHQGNNGNIYAVYKIDTKIKKADAIEKKYSAGCGSTRPPAGELTFDDCNVQRGAYWHNLSNVHGKQILEQENMTWDEFNVKCSGHLLSFEETPNIQRTGTTNIPHSVRFWVGERIWNYIHFGIESNLLTNIPENPSIKCAYYNKTAGKTEFGSCMSKHSYKCNETDMVPENTESPLHNSSAQNHDGPSLGVVIGIVVGLIVFLVILLISICIYRKRREARNTKSEPSINKVKLNEIQDRQLVYEEDCLDNDYDHLHENPEKFHNANEVNVYDVSRPCGDDSNILGSDVYDTTNELSKLNETYDSCYHTSSIKPIKAALSSDTYTTIHGPIEGTSFEDGIVPLNTDSSPPNAQTFDAVYHEIAN